MRCHPALVRRPGHPAHRRSVRGRLAPPGVPPRAGGHRDEMGVPAMTVLANGNGHVVRNVFIVGGAGFIGSHFVERLLSDQATEAVTVYDNFSSGRAWHLQPFESDARLRVVKADVEDLATLASAMRGHETIIHLASNPDIARAATDPAVDFDQGTRLDAPRGGGRPPGGREGASFTHRAAGCTATSAISKRPRISGRSSRSPPTERRKLAGEALIASYCLHVRPDRLRLPVRKRGGSPPDPRRRFRLRAAPHRRPHSPADPG